MVHCIQDFLKTDSRLVGTLSAVTGLSKSTIINDFESDHGPTLVIGDYPVHEHQDIKNQEIGLNYSSLLKLNKI
jgi:hypothetical protein